MCVKQDLDLELVSFEYIKQLYFKCMRQPRMTHAKCTSGGSPGPGSFGGYIQCVQGYEFVTIIDQFVQRVNVRGKKL